MYGTHAELAARGVDTNALLGLLQEGEAGRNGTGKDKCKWKPMNRKFPNVPEE